MPPTPKTPPTLETPSTPETLPSAGPISRAPLEGLEFPSSQPWAVADGLLLGEGEAEALRAALAEHHHPAAQVASDLHRAADHIAGLDVRVEAQVEGPGPLEAMLEAMAAPDPARWVGEIWARAEALPRPVGGMAASASYLVPLSMAELHITPNRVSLAPVQAPWNRDPLPNRAMELLREAAAQCLDAQVAQAPSGRLFLVRSTPLQLSAVAPDLLLDHHLPDFEPAGADARAWRRFQNSVQMAWTAEASDLRLPGLLWPSPPARLASRQAPAWFDALGVMGLGSRDSLHWLATGAMAPELPAVDWVLRWTQVLTLAQTSPGGKVCLLASTDGGVSCLRLSVRAARARGLRRLLGAAARPSGPEATLGRWVNDVAEFSRPRSTTGGAA